MTRKNKRITIIAIYIFIFSAFIGMFIAWLIPNPSCQDGIKNQNEVGVDCGGVCAACVIELVGQDLIVKQSNVVYGGEGKYDVVARINNPNPLYGAEQFSYTVSLLDQNGDVIAKRDGTNFILPNEDKLIVEIGLESVKKPSSVKFVINDVDWIKFTEFEAPHIVVKNQKFGLIQNGVGYAEAFGTVSNDSPYDFHNVGIYVILQDERGVPIAVNKTEIRTLDAGEQRDFRLLWPHEFPGNIALSQMQAETNIFDSLNFMEKYLPGGRYQEFIEE